MTTGTTEVVWDLESDGLLDSITKIHCISWRTDTDSGTLTDYDSMREFFSTAEKSDWVLIGHNVIQYDFRAIERILKVTYKGRKIDTLPLAWYLHTDRLRYGLEEYGEEYGVPKPKIDDWENLSLEDYCHRCSEDTKINQKLWGNLKRKLLELYNGDDLGPDHWRILNYLNFKMECAAEQEDVGVCLGRDKAIRHRDELLQLQFDKVEQLKTVMPKVPKWDLKHKPKATHKQDGTLSSHGQKWFQFLREHKLPVTEQGPVKYVKEYVEPNPNSHQQVKDWLFDLGWEPQTFKYDKDDEGNERKIPQVRNEDKVLCASVLELKDKEPGIEVLEGLSIIQHRLSIFEGFVECAYQKDGLWYLTAGIGGLTNTLRFKHRKPLVNLPKVGVPWGEEIRSCLIAPPGYVLCGSDMVSLEDTTKRHYMYPHDPDYVDIMQQPGFDPHVSLAVFAGVVTEEDYQFFTNASKEDKITERYKKIKSIRQAYKTVNYSAVYSVGAKKLARTTKLPVREAAALLEAYWQRNWSVKAAVKDIYVKTLKNGETWLKNPVSGFYINLRYEKDLFSSLNQSTGVYCFDTWVALCRTRGLKLIASFHDELLTITDDPDATRNLLLEAIAKTNERIKLNIPLSVDVQFGGRYSDCH